MRDDGRKDTTINRDGGASQSADAVTGTCDQAIRAAYLAHIFPEQPDREMAGAKPGSVVNADPDIDEGEELVDVVNGDPDDGGGEAPVGEPPGRFSGKRLM